VWDPATGQELLTLRGAPQRYWDPAFNPRLAFSPDGDALAGTNWDGSVALWSAPILADAPARVRWQEQRRQASAARAGLWHLDEAAACLDNLGNRAGADRLLAARFHLAQADRAQLPPLLRERRTALQARLEEASRPKGMP
jgi:hypothetical protein